MSTALQEALAEIFAKDLSRLRALRDLLETEQTTEETFKRECWAGWHRAMTATGTMYRQWKPAPSVNGEINFDDADSPEAQAEQVLNNAGFYVRADSRNDRFVLVKKQNGEAFLRGLTIEGVINAASAVQRGDDSGRR